MAKDMMMRLQLQLTDKISGALGKISQSTKLSTQALKANQNQLRNLEKSMGLVQKLKREQDAFRRSNTEMRKSQAELIALKKTGSATAAQIKAQTSLVKKNAAAFDAQKQKLIEFRRVAADAGIKNLANDERRLASEIKNTTVLITSQNSALKRMDQLRNNRNQALGQAAAVGGVGLGMRMIGQRGLNMSRSVIEAGLGFDESMAMLAGQMNLAGNSEQLTILRELVLAEGTKDAQDMTGGLSALFQSGFNIDQIVGATPMLLAAADAAGMTITATAESFSGVMKCFGADFNQFAQISDVLVGAANAGNIPIEKLNNVLSSVSTNAAAAGLSIEQTAAMIGLMNKAGIGADEAGSALDAVLKKLQAPDTKALAALGIRSGQAKDVPELLQMISQKTAGMSSIKELEHFKSIFGAGNSAAMQQLLAQMRTGGMDDIMKLIANSSGSTISRAEANTDSLRDKTDTLDTSLTNLKVLITEMNKAWLKEFADTIIETVNHVRSWIKANPELVKTLSKVFFYGSIILTVLGSLAIAIASIAAPTIMLKFALGMLGIKFAGFLPLIATLGNAFLRLGLSMLSNPLFLAVALLAAAAYLIYQNWEGIAFFFKDLWSQVKEAFDGGITGVNEFLINWSPLGIFYKIFAVVFDYFDITLPEHFTTFGKNIMQGLINGITSAAGAVKDSVVGMGSDIANWFSEKLSINSPSRVFASIATSIPEGVGKGIHDGLPMLKHATVGMSDELVNNFPTFDGSRFISNSGSAVRIDGRQPLSASNGTTSQVSVGGDTNHFYISGTDEKTIQRAVEQALEQVNRKKQARALSSYNDR